VELLRYLRVGPCRPRELGDLLEGEARLTASVAEHEPVRSLRIWLPGRRGLVAGPVLEAEQGPVELGERTGIGRVERHGTEGGKGVRHRKADHTSARRPGTGFDAVSRPSAGKTGPMRLTSVEALRGIYRRPVGSPVDKVIHRLDAHCVDFVAKSPFFVLSSADADGVCDGSPKGGPAGFVQVLDDKRLAWADFSGNNRLDSFQNLVANDSVALLFLIPGLDETLRVNGRAELVVDEELRERFAIAGKAARVVVVVTVEEAYIHCAKALRRAGLWSSETWPDRAELPSAACIVKDHAKIDADVEVIEEYRQRDLQTTLWRPGGDGARE
jgi:hypothetical protein